MTPCQNCGKPHLDGITIEHRWIEQPTQCIGGKCEQLNSGQLLCAAHLPPKKGKQ